MGVRHVAVLAVFLLSTLPFCRTVFSVVPPPPAPASAQNSDFTMEGKITDKSAGKLTINSGDNIIFHVLYNDKTVITKKDGSPGTAQDFHIGVRIDVAGDLAESGEITARTIALEPEGSEKQ